MPAVKNSLRRQIWKHRQLLLFLVPAIAWFIIFCYIPMYGVVIAFQKFNPVIGFFKSPFVGLENFAYLFRRPDFVKVLRNTIFISALKLLIGFPVPIIFALLLNEIGSGVFKKTTQSVSYLPHFISWVVVSGIWYKLLSYDGGLINEILLGLGIIDEPVLFMGQGAFFIPVIVLSQIWKTMGWSAIIYIAGLASIDQNIYEAATIDGAGRFQKAIHISIPGIAHIIVILAIFSVAGLLNAGFDQMQTFLNPMVMEVGDILDTFILRQLMSSGIDSLSIGAAAGLFQSFIGLCLFMGVNRLARAVTGESII